MTSEGSGVSTSGSPAPTVPGGGPAREVFVVFLRLGLTSFGGPVAHLGYFRDAFVVRRWSRWRSLSRRSSRWRSGRLRRGAW